MEELEQIAERSDVTVLSQERGLVVIQVPPDRTSDGELPATDIIIDRRYSFLPKLTIAPSARPGVTVDLHVAERMELYWLMRILRARVANTDRSHLRSHLALRTHADKPDKDS